MYEGEREQIGQIISEWNLKLLALPVKMITDNRNKQNRTIKQILGHLTDSAVNNHHRIVRLQYTEKLVFPDYRQDNDTWIKIQNFQQEKWENLVVFWKYYNMHLIHIIENIDPEFLKNTWTDFEGTIETLDSIVKGYLCHLNLHINEIKELMY
jgi:hypothetical protein